MFDKSKVLVLGRGFLGKAFERAGYKVLSKYDFEMKENDFKNVRTGYEDDPWYYVQGKLRDYDVIINCMGKSGTRWCEEDENFEEAMWCNGEVPKILSQCCGNHKKFVHISTGCLYDDNRRTQKETDFVVAHCRYTLTKWVGEIGCDPKKDLIIRPRLYFGDFEDKNNLILKILKFDKLLLNQNSFTSVHIIVDAIEALLENDQVGVFNVACESFAPLHELGLVLGKKADLIDERELHQEQGLFLVNNIMDISKLKKFYKPPFILDEFKRCAKELGVL